ncbi:carboxylesterase/lipase family protein [Nonomuraea terrae]|uniref:carboxylesterase/lipase family protein n=1 Tax=Nonomuraea terrae TaxID=2530383 RepID=UPI00378A93D4
MPKVVTISHGQLRGTVTDGVAAFLGVPYAAPPFGPHRFRPPAPPQPWDGIRNATHYGPTVPKSSYAAPLDRLMADPTIPGEDCLNLNIWTPDAGGRGLPVMVWIHGGTFLGGSGALDVYNGAAFARDGVVLVTINYRLGVEGFADLPGAPPNRGLLDQLAALRWVRDNITVFGGDPDQVTVFGESAGGVSVISLLSLERSQRHGLFWRAIAQSGFGNAVQDPDDARLVTRELAARLGVAPTADGFARLSPAAILPVQASLAAEVAARPDPDRWGATTSAASMPFMPVLDGRLLTRHPEQAIADGAGAEVALMVGCTSEESRPSLFATGRDSLITFEVASWVLTSMGLDPALIQSHRAAMPDASPADVLAAALTDGYFRLPALRIAHAHPQVWMYEFAWRTPELDMGAGHALELGFVFDNPRSPDMAALVGANPPQSLATAMHDAWVDFAAHGDPGWPRFTPHSRTVKLFDGTDNPVASSSPTSQAAAGTARPSGTGIG